MATVTELFRMHMGGTVRLGIGERVDQEGTLARVRAQDAFSRALFAHAWETMVGLFDGKRLAGFLRFFIVARAVEDPNPIRDAGLSTDALIRRIEEDVEPFLDDLKEWTESKNLNAPWFMLAAIGWMQDVAFSFHESDMGKNTTPAPFLSGLPSVSIESKLTDILRAPGPRLYFAGKEHPPYGNSDPTYWPMDVFPDDPETGDGTAEFDWNPAVESRKANEDRAVEWFTARYRAAQDARLKEAEERYPNRTTTRRYEHFVWLVQYQVLEWSYSKVARNANRSRQAVTEAIRETAALIDLPLRGTA